MNIGRDVIGTMTNTLILAYVGGSLTLILLFMASNLSILEILNKETIAEQVISALAGSMGVVYTVPITSFVYSVLNKDQVIYKKVSDNKLNGKANVAHNHDDKYSKLSHNHDGEYTSAAEIDELEETLKTLIASKANITQITSLYNRFNELVLATVIVDQSWHWALEDST
jgi:uncharacterized membrane protein